MVDLGLVKPYTDDETGRHIPYAENRSICGTLRYIGLNVHKVLRFSAFLSISIVGIFFKSLFEILYLNYYLNPTFEGKRAVSTR